MNFLSIKFCVFFAVLLSLYAVVKTERTRQRLLLLACYVFYAFSSIRFLLLLAALSVVCWYLGLMIKRFSDGASITGRRCCLGFGIAVCLAALGYFKYRNFFVESFACFLYSENVVFSKMILPLGISFYVLEAVSYLCDVYLGKIEPEREPWNVMLYIGFFPQIVSGPIVKARDFMPQLREEHRITEENLSYGVQLVAAGVFKKVVIADRLGVVVDSVYRAPGEYGGFSLLMAVAAYAIQIYCDFSGYSDIAIGLARILGYDLGLNFNAPYIAANPSDFWKRWHISLSSWLMEYVYIPLGGNRKGKYRTYVNLMLTMLISGLWHGAAWNFIVWGAFHGLASVMYKIYCEWGGREMSDGLRSAGKVKKGMAVTVNVLFVWLLWIPFRATDLWEAVLIMKRIFTMAQGIRYISVFAVIYTVMIMGVQIYALRKNHGEKVWRQLNLKLFHNKVIFCVFLLLIMMFGYVGNTAFIYAQF